MDEMLDILLELEGKICCISILKKSGELTIHDKQKIKSRLNLLTFIDLGIQFQLHFLEIISNNAKKGIFLELRVLNHDEIESLVILGK